MSLFIERLDHGLVNISLLQTVYIDTEDDTKVVLLFINGEKYVEDLVTSEAAQTRYETLKTLLLGGSIEELEEIIEELQDELRAVNQSVDEAVDNIININGEEV